jgi:hypothetical protein
MRCGIVFQKNKGIEESKISVYFPMQNLLKI